MFLFLISTRVKQCPFVSGPWPCPMLINDSLGFVCVLPCVFTVSVLGEWFSVIIVHLSCFGAYFDFLNSVAMLNCVFTCARSPCYCRILTDHLYFIYF